MPSNVTFSGAPFLARPLQGLVGRQGTSMAAMNWLSFWTGGRDQPSAQWTHSFPFLTVPPSCETLPTAFHPTRFVILANRPAG
jgi:hypothetical protein